MTLYRCPEGHVSVEWTLPIPAEPVVFCAVCGKLLVRVRKLRLVK